MSLRWGERSLAAFIAHDDGSQAIYGVIQGGIYPDLRRSSVAGVSALPFFRHSDRWLPGKNPEPNVASHR